MLALIRKTNEEKNQSIKYHITSDGKTSACGKDRDVELVPVETGNEALGGWNMCQSCVKTRFYRMQLHKSARVRKEKGQGKIDV
jgi:hypothetical protein